MYRRKGSSYQLLKLVEDTGQIGLWAFDLATGEMAGSSGLMRITGLSASESPRGLLTDLIHPADRAEQTDLVEMLHRGKPVQRTYRIIRPDRTVRWVKVTAEIVLGMNDQPVRVEGVVFDVSDPQEARKFAEESRTRYQGLLDAITSVVWSTSADGRPHPSATWQAVTGQSTEAQMNGQWLEVVHPDDRCRAEAAWVDALANRTQIDIDFRVRCADGTYRWFKNRGVPLFDQAGAVSEWIGVLLSINRTVARESMQPLVASLTGPVSRAARGLLDWSISDLAAAARLSVASIKRFEAEEKGVRVKTQEAIRRALEKAGIAFMTWDGRPGIFGLVANQSSFEQPGSCSDIASRMTGMGRSCVKTY